MAIDILDEIQLIESHDCESDDVVLFGNKKGGIPVFVTETQLELFSCAANNIYHPIIQECRNLLDFCGIEDIVLEISSKKQGGYISNVFVNDKKIGMYSFDELIYLISASVPKIKINENLLETEDYENISKSNVPLKLLKKRTKGPTIDFPDAKFVEFTLNKVEKNLKEERCYKMHFLNEKTTMAINMPRHIVPMHFLETLKKTDELLIADFKNRDSSSFDSLSALLKNSKAKIKNAFIYDRMVVCNDIVYPENYANLTCAIEVERNKKKQKFILPDTMGILYAADIGRLWIREPLISKENISEPIYFG